jgi:hypothetical protein
MTLGTSARMQSTVVCGAQPLAEDDDGLAAWAPSAPSGGSALGAAAPAVRAMAVVHRFV